MSTTPTYPPAESELNTDPFPTFQLQPPIRWSAAWATELDTFLGGIDSEVYLLKIRAILQFKYCEMHRKGKMTFNKLCLSMILLEDIFKDVIITTKNCVFTRYLSVAFAKGGNIAGITRRVVKAVYADTAVTPVIKEGVHQEIFRHLFIWAANAVKDLPVVSDRRKSAARITLLLLDSTEGKNEIWTMDGATEEQMLDIITTLR